MYLITEIYIAENDHENEHTIPAEENLSGSTTISTNANAINHLQWHHRLPMTIRNPRSRKRHTATKSRHQKDCSHPNQLASISRIFFQGDIDLTNQSRQQAFKNILLFIPGGPLQFLSKKL